MREAAIRHAFSIMGTKEIILGPIINQAGKFDNEDDRGRIP